MNKTSKNLDKSLSSALKKVLFCVKRYAPIGTSKIAEHLTISGEAARLHVQKLVQMGLIEGEIDSTIQVGRPKQEWIVTEAGNRYFPDSHAELTLQLIHSVKDVFGDSGLDQLIAAREMKTLDRYQTYCKAPTLLARLKKLVELRYDEGYMAHLEKEGDDYLLIEEHCPICAAAKACQQFCRSELEIFRTVLGSDVRVEREEYLLSQGQRCIYRISQK